jgi:hypothetical protein
MKETLAPLMVWHVFVICDSSTNHHAAHHKKAAQRFEAIDWTCPWFGLQNLQKNDKPNAGRANPNTLLSLMASIVVHRAGP